MIANSFALSTVLFLGSLAGCIQTADTGVDDSAFEAEETSEVAQALVVSMNVAANRTVTRIGSGSGDPAVVTNTVFATESTGWNNLTFAAVVANTTPASGLSVELEKVFPIEKLVLQGDCNDKYLVEGSVDGSSWVTMYDFATTTCPGLRTRPAVTLPSPIPAKFVRITPHFAVDYAFSVSELQAFASGLQCGSTICVGNEVCLDNQCVPATPEICCNSKVKVEGCPEYLWCPN